MLRQLMILGCFIFLASCGGGSGAIKNSGGSYIPASTSSAAQSSAAVSSLSSTAVSLLSSSAVSSAATSSEAESGLYGLYVSLHMGRNDQLLGNAQREEQFIKFVRDGGFTYLIFYELEGMGPTSTKAQQLASLVSRAKLTAGVTEVGAALGDVGEADTIVAYNNGRPVSERIDVLNVEYEFWNKPAPKTEFASNF